MTVPLVEVEDLSVAFDLPDGRIEAVRGVSFTLGRERLGIVGESGSGKSQTGRALLGLTARNGTVSAKRLAFDGIDLLRASERERRALCGSRMTMVMQDPRYSLNPVMTVGQQIVEAYRLTGTVDYILKVLVPDVAAYDQVYKAMIEKLEFSQINSSMSMEELKFTTAVPTNYLL